MGDLVLRLEQAREDFAKLSKREQEAGRRFAERLRQQHDKQSNPTCRHCGQDIGKRCYSCYG